MLLVATGQLREGMIMAQPVFHPSCADMVLLATDYVLDPPTIARLRDFELSHVWVRFPGLEELDTVPSEKVSRGHAVLHDAINRSITRLEGRVAVQASLYRLKQAIGRMMTEIIVHPDHEVITYQIASCGPSMSGHLANCAYLSLLLGAHMSGYLRTQRRTLPPEVAENTAQLGLGALLHDIGKMHMPDDLQGKSILDEEAEWPEYQFHVRAGYEELRESVSILAANVILNHHQRFDGNGFPEKEDPKEGRRLGPLSGRNIHIFSRIVAVVDVFDHLLCPDGEPVPTIKAIHELKSERFRGWFDPVVVEALLRLVPPFMVGSTVTLSDETEAVVVDNHPEAPCKPSVRLLSGPLCEKNTRIRGRTLDLRMCRKTHVQRVGDFDVTPYLFSGEFEVRQEEKEPEPVVEDAYW